MKLVIEIPKEEYYYLQNNKEIVKFLDNRYLTMILNGTPLPEEDNTMEWIQHIDTKVDNSGKWRRKCSKCGCETNNFGYDKFCPNCGAKAMNV